LIEIRDVRWTTNAERKLPAWKMSTDWKSGYDLLWLGNSQESSTGVLTKFHQLESLLSLQNPELQRRCIYIPFDLEENGENFFEFASRTLGFEIPLLPNGAKLTKIGSETGRPGLAIALDFIPEMASSEKTTVVIPHWESLGFLRLCIESISKVFLNEKPKILIVDDNSSEDVWKGVQLLSSIHQLECVQVQRHDQSKVPDVGALLDFAVQRIETQFVCMLDADTMIVNTEFLSRPLEFLRDQKIISVGLDTDLGQSYHSNSNWRRFKPRTSKVYGLPGAYSVTNNLYRVMRTLDAKAISSAEPFSRRVSDRKFRDQVGRFLRKLDSKLLINSRFHGASREVIKKRPLNSNWPSMPPTSDNGVNANFWMDANNMGRKINIPIISYGLLTPNDGVCLQNISNSLVHVALSTRALSKVRREIEDAGRPFYEVVDEIMKNEFEYEELSPKLTTMSKTFKYLG